MPRTRSGFYPARGAARRRTGWSVGPGAQTPTTISGSAVTILGSGATSLIDGQTLVRTRGHFDAFLTAATGANDGFSGAFALGIINEDAFAIGATTIMDPVADSDWEGWFFHRFFVAAQLTSTLADGVNAVMASVRFDVDSKAMRKLAEGDVLFACMETLELGTAVMEVHVDTRVLTKLP